MSIHTLCKPRPSVHAADRRATVLNLDTFLKGQVGGAEFFEENSPTLWPDLNIYVHLKTWKLMPT